MSCNGMRWLRPHPSASLVLSILALPAIFLLNTVSPLFAQQEARQAASRMQEPVGELTGRFTVRGKLPASKLFGPVMPRTGKRITDDSLVASGNEQALANLFVFMSVGSVSSVRKGEPPADTRPTDPLVVGIVDGHAIPRALCARSRQRLVFRNADDEQCILHFDPDELAPSLVDERDQLVIAAHGQRDIEVRRYNNFPGFISSKRQGWIRCGILVTDHPYVSVTDRNGNFRIRDIPVGKWIFSACHERSKQVERVFINGRQVEWKHGKFECVIHSGTNSLGKIEIPAEPLRNLKLASSRFAWNGPSRKRAELGDG